MTINPVNVCGHRTRVSRMATWDDARPPALILTTDR